MKSLRIWTLLLLLLFVSCAKAQKTELAGTWIREGDGKEITLTQDRAYIYHIDDANKLKGMWRLEQLGVLEIGMPNFDASMLVKAKFNIKGKTLIITDDEGQNKVFKRKI